MDNFNCFSFQDKIQFTKEIMETKFQIKALWLVVIFLTLFVISFNYITLKKISELRKAIYQISQIREKIKESLETLERKSEIRPYLIEVTDQGFSPIGFSAPIKTKISITLKNFDKKEHSFTIDEIGVDTGLIEGGKETTINFVLPDLPQNLNFYSKGVNKNTPGFQGQIEVFKL